MSHRLPPGIQTDEPRRQNQPFASRRPPLRLLFPVIISLALVAGLGEIVAPTGEAAVPTPNAPAQPVVAGNQLKDSRTGQVWTPHGSSLPDLGYSCTQGWTPGLPANSLTTAASWGIDVIRIALNQDCWLGVDGAPAAGYGTAAQYQAQVKSWVTLAHQAGLAVILDLHASAPSGTRAIDSLWPMADNQSAAFWTSVATAYKADPSVMFELFNKPYSRGTYQLTWACWRDGGCLMPNVGENTALNGSTFTVTGMAAMVAAVRNAGAKQPILLGGLNYANDLSQWLAYKPNDAQLVAAWHNYLGQGCSTTTCWNSQVAPVAKQVPVLITEIGYEPSNTGYFESAMTWADQNGIGYLPWAWCNQAELIAAGNPTSQYALYTGTTFAPSAEGTAFKNHIAKLAPPAPPLTITTTTLATATAGIAASFQLAASGGTGAYTWSLASGSLDGLTLSTAGVIAGKPTAAGTVTFTVKVTSGTLTATQTLTLNVVALTRWTMGYYVGYEKAQMPVAEIDWTALTHLVVGRVVPNANGTLTTTLDIDATNGPALAKSLATTANANGVVPLLMVGGAGTHDAFLAAAKTNQTTLVTNLVNTMNTWGYKGLDLDWQPINTADQPYIAQLVTSLKTAAPSAILTMPVGAINPNYQTAAAWYGQISAKLDRINIMTYDMVDPNPADGWKSWHSSALTGGTATTPSAVDTSVAAYKTAGVPAAKLGVGTGFFGQCWTAPVTGPGQAIGTSKVVADDSTMTYSMIMQQYYSAAAYKYDATAKAPYLSSTTGLGPNKCTYLSYEDPTSVAAKGAWAKQQGLGANIVWTINQGHNATGAGSGDALLLAVLRSFSI